MKVVYVSASYLPSREADSVNVMKMCNAFSDNGLDVTLLGIKGDESNIDIYQYYKVLNKFKIVLGLPGKRHVFNRLKNIIVEVRNADFVYTRYALGAFLCGVIMRKHVFYEYHFVMNKKYNQLLETICSKYDTISHVFITNALKEMYIQRNSILLKRMTLILPDGADKPSINSKSDFNNKVLTCGYIGSFLPGKGIELVIDIANKLPEFKFHIVGGKDNEIEALKRKQLNDNILWHGYLEPSKAMDVLENKIDIALLPNQKNVIIGDKKSFDIGSCTSPMKLFEYMSYGKVIVASRLPVLEEVVRDGSNAFLADYNDVEQWVDAINKINNDRNLAKKISDRAYSDFEANYTWKMRAKKVLNELGRRK